ncbi:MAG: VOC family protein [Cyanobacteria bacterium P01_A01_bin.84]
MTKLLIGNPLLEIDHIFVCVKSVPNTALLRQLGLVCSDYSLSHPQQGTASNLIFFENSYIELIWVEDEDTSEIYAMRSGIDFIARSNWEDSSTSPFGIALHQRGNSINSDRLRRVLPHQSLNSGHSSTHYNTDNFINFAASNLVNQIEPLCFVIPESISFPNLFNPSIEAHQRLANHPLGIKKLTNIRIAIEKSSNFSDPLSMLEENGMIEVERDSYPVLELTFDYASNRSLDLQPIGIPVILKY